MFHVKSPLLESLYLSKHLGSDVYVKLDVVQPSGSFKIRGLSNSCYKAVHEQGCRHLVCASGGNAGLAVVYSAKRLGVPVTIVVPESTPEIVRQRIIDEGATLIVHGKAFDEANIYALELAKQEGCVYIHPFDDPNAWEGHSTLITEIKDQLEQLQVFRKPSCIVTVVGGGGLLCGVAQGLHKVGWNDVPIVACETKGADSFSQSVAKGELVTLPSIDSIAKTLGAKTVCKEAFEWTKKHTIVPLVVSDKMAVDAIAKFLDHHRCLVEPACGAGLAAVYQKLQPLQEILSSDPQKDPFIVVIVCGGNLVSLSALAQWQNEFNK